MRNEKGKLVRWLDDKGFGFIKPDNGDNDIFIHISALKGMSRKPIIGDVIHYQIGFDKNGKTRAVNAKIEGVSQVLTLTAFEERKISKPPATKAKPYRTPANFSKPQKRFNPFPIIIVVVILAFIYSEVSKRRSYTAPVAMPMAEVSTEMKEPQFQCRGKVWCSEMTSYEEAVFYLRNCPGTKMDGDRDGIPCESQF
ncbi:MAG: cold shock domain-containing protein [Gammaproteobacteria bacterium]